MSFLDKAKDAVSGAVSDAKEALDKAGDFVEEKVADARDAATGNPHQLSEQRRRAMAGLHRLTPLPRRRRGNSHRVSDPTENPTDPVTPPYALPAGVLQWLWNELIDHLWPWSRSGFQAQRTLQAAGFALAIGATLVWVLAAAGRIEEHVAAVVNVHKVGTINVAPGRGVTVKSASDSPTSTRFQTNGDGDSSSGTAVSVAAAGAVLVPVNPLLKAAQVNHILRDSGAKVLCGHADLLAPLVGHLPADVTLIAVDTPADVAEPYGIRPVRASEVPGALDYAAVIAGRATFEPAGGWGGDHHDGAAAALGADARRAEPPDVCAARRWRGTSPSRARSMPARRRTTAGSPTAS